MMRRIRTVTLGIFLASLVGGAAVAGPALGAEDACNKAKCGSGWCEKCHAGFVAGVKIPSHELYNALAGKKLEAASIQCPGCKEGLASDGACAHCKAFFAGGEAYRSRYAAALARGTAVDPARLAATPCEGCKAAASVGGWCEQCQVGIVAGRLYKDPLAHADAVRALAVIREAAELSGRCEGCAVAMVTDGTCEACHASFNGGRKTAL